MSQRKVMVYLVLERVRGWGGKCRVVRHSVHAPSLKRGQCAVKVWLLVPEAAFEPVLAGPEIAFAIEDTLRAQGGPVPVEEPQA